MLRTSWTPGPAAGRTGPVLVAVTAFDADRARDLPGIYRSGLALRRRCGSVSIWQSQQALRILHQPV